VGNGVRQCIGQRGVQCASGARRSQTDQRKPTKVKQYYIVISTYFAKQQQKTTTARKQNIGTIFETNITLAYCLHWVFFSLCEFS